jgi:hypothetical protein
MDSLDHIVQELHIKTAEVAGRKDGGSWKIPFFILVLFVIGVLVAMYMFYLHLVKKWKLP